MSIDTITISREKCSRLFAYSPYVPITRVNSDYHEISRGGKLYHSWRSSQVHNHKSPLTITWCNTVSPPFSVVTLRRRRPSETFPWSSRSSAEPNAKEGRKSAREASERKWNKLGVSRAGERLLARASVLERTEWGRRGERTSHRSTTACTRPMMRRVKRRVGLFDPRTPRASRACAMILLGLCSGRD